MPNPNHRIEGGGVGERAGGGEGQGESETIKSEFLKVL